MENLKPSQPTSKTRQTYEKKSKNQIQSEIRNGKKTIAGILQLESTTKYGLNKKRVPYYLFKPLDWRYPNFIVASSYKKKENIFVEIKFHKWERKIPYGCIENLIGNVYDINNQYEAILGKYNIRRKNINKSFKDFCYELEDELKEKRVNFKDKNIFTIDPVGCKDMDDALHFEKISDNEFQIGIHITDVSFYVREGSELDIEASERLFSVYTPTKVINMLPDKLSEDLCSLVKGQERKTISVLVNFTEEGEMISYQICPGLIITKNNYSYQEIDTILENKDQDSDIINMFK